MIIRNRPITPRRGKELSAQGIALGMWVQKKIRPERAKEFLLSTLLPLQGDSCVLPIPRALPWAIVLLAFQAAYQVFADNHIL